MSPALRKAALTVHVASSAGVLGAVAVFLALAVVGLNSDELRIVRAVYPAMDLATSYIIVPLVGAVVFTGIVQGLGTSWGLLRHYWVLLKLLIMIIVATVLLMQLEQIAFVASASDDISSTDFRLARQSLAIHAGGGLCVLLLPLALSIYKPAGMTRYGWRNLHQQM